MMLRVCMVLLLVAAVRAIVCPPGFCDSVNCPEVSAENCDGRVSKEGSVCGCCDACIQQLGEGQSCFLSSLRGVPPRSECKSGLFCDPETNVCTRLSLK
uniref:Putative conserved secreted protein n=1 Tax=Amblyomma tuberculatum TaxID=48802 RepID=A0A6M2E105_9ACAR